MTKKASPPVRMSNDIDAPDFAPPDPKSEWGGFVDIRLTEDQKAQYKHWQENGAREGMWLLFTDILAIGVRFSLSWDLDNDCFTAAFTASIPSMGDRRYSLTARAGTWETAVYLLVWKHEFLMEGDWTNYRPRTGFKSEV